MNNHNIQGYDVVILAETWLSERDSNAYNIHNFEQIRMDSTIVQSHLRITCIRQKEMRNTL